MADAPLFFAGGQCLQRLGVLVQRSATWEEGASLEAFTRAGTATFTDYNGDTKTAEANQPRIEWQDSDTPTLLLTAAASEIFYADFPYPPQAMTVYMDVRNWVAGINDVTLWHLGGAGAGTDPRLALKVAITTGNLSAVYDDGSTVASTGSISAPSSGERVETLATLAADGTVDLAASIDGGAQVDVASDAGGALPTAWADTRLYIGSAGTSQAADSATYALKVARGVQTFAHMRAL